MRMLKAAPNANPKTDGALNNAPRWALRHFTYGGITSIKGDIKMSKDENPTKPDGASTVTNQSEIDTPNGLIETLDVDVLDNSVLVNRIVGVAIGKIEDAYSAENCANNIRARTVANIVDDVRAELLDYRLATPNGSRRISYEEIIQSLDSEFFDESLKGILTDK